MHDQQQKGQRNDKSGKDQKESPKKGAGQDVQKGQNEEQKKEQPRRMEHNR